MEILSLGPVATFLIIVLVLLVSGVKILREYERGVIFRLGRMVPHRGPGLIYVIPLVERMVRITMRTMTVDVPPQDVITRDNVSIKINAVLYFRVVDPDRAIREVEDFIAATYQLSQVTLRSVCGEATLDEVLTERERLASRVQGILDAQTDPWGVKVANVEMKDIDLPQSMERAMAKQAQADRQRRAKVIHAEGEFQAAQRLAEAAEILNRQPSAIQLRFLQTLVDVGRQDNSTTVVPIPVDLLASMIKRDET